MLLTTYHLSQASSQWNHILTTKNLFFANPLYNCTRGRKDFFSSHSCCSSSSIFSMAWRSAFRAVGYFSPFLATTNSGQLRTGTSTSTFVAAFYQIWMVVLLKTNVVVAPRTIPICSHTHPLIGSIWLLEYAISQGINTTFRVTCKTNLTELTASTCSNYIPI